MKPVFYSNSFTPTPYFMQINLSPKKIPWKTFCLAAPLLFIPTLSTHRYEVSAIEASEVRRSFLVATKEVDKSDIAMYPQDQWSYTNKLRNFFNKGE
jgi:hypothetical protein